MKSFRTEIDLKPSSTKIRHSTPIFTIGSCFADAIGKRLNQNKFVAAVNPMGVIYNPLSIHKALRYALHNELPLPDTYVENQGMWANFDFHSSLSAMSKNDAQTNISNAIGATHHFLKDAEVLIITYGTSKVYEHADTGEPVANCHKMPSHHFSLQWLTPENISESFAALFENLQKWKPGLKVILTVSPVRHTKDTLELNSVSKSVLRWACHSIVQRYPEVEYFPAFEIMMDDLRDYRFYEADMIHPSEEALDYIWQKFCDAFFDPPTMALLKRWQDIAAALHHRPFHPRSTEHKKFLSETLLKLEELNLLIPVKEEIKRIESQLS